MRWTLRHHSTSDANADGEIVWSWRPDAGVKSCRDRRCRPYGPDTPARRRWL